MTLTALQDTLDTAGQASMDAFKKNMTSALDSPEAREAVSGFFAMGMGLLIGIAVIALVIMIFMIAAMWKINTKAGKPGWACIVPIYSAIVLLEIVGKPWWWLFLMLIPIVNIVIIIMVLHRLSLSFGKDAGFTVGLIFLGWIFFPILGFGSAKYVGPGGIPVQA